MRYPELLIDIPQNLKIYSFEGIDGSGKSTGIQIVKQRLLSFGVDSTVVASPSNTLLGKFLRENLKNLEPWQRHMLFVMDMVGIIRRQTMENSKSVLLWDRYIDSNVVSNKDTEPEESVKWIECLPTPRRTFLYDITPETVIRERIESVHDHSMDLVWQRLKYERYHQLVKQDPERIIVVDATQGRETIAEVITDIIVNDLGIRGEI